MHLFIYYLFIYLPKNLATHLPNLGTHLPDFATHLPDLATHLPNVATHLPNVAIDLPNSGSVSHDYSRGSGSQKKYLRIHNAEFTISHSSGAFRTTT
jgi:hypothetical protein